MRCVIGSGMTFETTVDTQIVPRIGETVFFIGGGRHLVGVVENVVHWLEDEPYVMIDLVDDSVDDHGKVTA